MRSLRHWDEVGLLRPSGRSDGGFRLYTEADERRAKLERQLAMADEFLDLLGRELGGAESRKPASRHT